MTFGITKDANRTNEVDALHKLSAVVRKVTG